MVKTVLLLEGILIRHLLQVNDNIFLDAPLELLPSLKNLVNISVLHVARSDVDKESWDVQDVYKALLYILPMGTNAHDIWDYVALIDGKTCVIDYYPVSYAWARYITVCFDSVESLNAVIETTPVLKGANLCWFCLVSAKCAEYGKMGHTSLVCPLGGKKNVSSGALLQKTLSNLDKSRLAAIYAKCLAPVAHPVFFGSNILINAGSSLEMKPILLVPLELNDRFATLECSLASLAECVDKLAKLNTSGPIVSQLNSRCQSLITPSLQNQGVNIVMSKSLDVAAGDKTVVGVVVFDPSVILKLEKTLNNLSIIVMSLLAKINNTSLRNIICWHKEINNLIFIVTKTKLKDTFDGVRIFTSGANSGYLDSDVVIIIDVFLVCHTCKISEVPGQLLSVKLFFKNKLSVSILRLYAGVSSMVQFFQADGINFFIARMVNESFFVILGGDFKEDSSCKNASFKKCVNLELVNSLVSSPAVKEPTWTNSRGVMKMIDFIFVSLNLVNAIVHHEVLDVSKHFDMNHKAVFMSVDLSGLLDTQLAFLHKQANRNQWKFNFKNASKNKWNDFKQVILANAAMLLDEFTAASSKKWFKNLDHVFTKESLKFHRLELLVSKIVRTSHEDGIVNFISLIGCWCSLDNTKASVVQDLIDSNVNFDHVHSALFSVRKSNRALKLAESLRFKKVNIRSAIDKRMDSFETNKGHTIKSVLEHSFYKVVLNYLVVDNKLVLKSDLIKSKCQQYQPLGYVFNGAFSGVICSIEFDEFIGVVFNLSNGKAAGLLGISNKLWKHCNRSVLDMLLLLLNSCLSSKSVPSSWKKAWVLMISKPYEWEGVLTNTCPIALIETACKILSKILSDRIFSACSTFDDMWKAYDLVGWKHLKKSLVRIKMCDKFIQFFGSIHKDCTNRVMTNFGLSDGYCHIFYDPLLCKVKCQKSMCGYRINSYFISRSGHTESQTGISSFLAASTFSATQHIFNIASEFFQINNISINNNKTYLGIFFSIEGLLKPSLVKTHLDVCFFTNMVLRKAVLDKQFLYLVSAVFHPIVNALICKGLKLKSGLSLNFPGNTIHHPLFYGLKFFSQIQSESKIALLVSFVNSGGILGHLFFYQSYNLQVWCWHPVHLLVSSVCTHINIFNNFLAGMVHIFFDCNLFLSGPLANSFRFHGGVPMSVVLGELRFYGIAFVDQLCAVFDWYAFKHWKKLDLCGPVLEWFKLSTAFLNNVALSSTQSLAVCSDDFLDIFGSCDFVFVCDQLSQIDAGILSVYMDGSLKNLGTASCRAGAATFFKDIGLGLGVGVLGLMSFTLAKLQAIALVLKCVPLSSSVHFFSNNQSALDACKSEMGLNLRVSWHKVKDYSGILGNEHTNMIADATSLSGWHLSPYLDEHFIVADYGIVSGNSRHFVHDIYHSICHACWEVGSGLRFLEGSLLSNIDWVHSLLVWHPNLHMATGFTSLSLANACMYFIKALHHCLPIAVQKCHYSKLYPSVLCLYCGDMEILDHVFSCRIDKSAHSLFGLAYLFSCVLQLLLFCISDSFVSIALFKGFVFDGWFHKAVSIFHDLKITDMEVVKFVHSLSMAFRNNIWLVYTKYCAYIKKNGLIFIDGLVLISVSGLASGFSAGVLKLLGIADAFGIHFGFCKFCLFFSGISGLMSVYIAV
ncbi:hypothetical protein G9A89_018718 [Geosiphon pyriformis]|nr:hypothetical protein G9A89_018718 [Geosiphon pyriformis]